MKNEKGITKLVLYLIIAVIIVAAIYYFSRLSRPMATVMTGGAEQAQPAIDKAKQATNTMNKVTQTTEEMTRKVNEDVEK